MKEFGNKLLSCNELEQWIKTKMSRQKRKMFSMNILAFYKRLPPWFKFQVLTFYLCLKFPYSFPYLTVPIWKVSDRNGHLVQPMMSHLTYEISIMILMLLTISETWPVQSCDRFCLKLSLSQDPKFWVRVRAQMGAVNNELSMLNMLFNRFCWKWTFSRGQILSPRSRALDHQWSARKSMVQSILLKMHL